MRVEKALVSVYDKSGLEEFARKLRDLEIELIATSGTYDFLTKRKIEALPLEELTEFPEILGGRVKTLHPKVHGGILARDTPDDSENLEKFNIEKIDLVVVDLYPFEKAVSEGKSHSEIIDKIDIGGQTLIRSAAKSFENTCILVGKAQYGRIIKELRKNDGEISKKTREELAARAFERVSKYDKQISEYFASL